jgi:CelD/BcsL family acetyltransferase involved in cellulose biosynthesis
VFDIALDNSFDFRADEYHALFESSRATAFQHPLWLDHLYCRLAPRLNAEPVIVTARWSRDGRLAMVLPLFRQRHGVMRVLEFADLKVSDYAAPVCDESIFTQLLRDDDACRRIRAALLPYDVLRLQKLRDDALPLDRLLGISSRTSMTMSAHSVPLNGPYETWRAERIDRSYRKELDKKGRQIRRKGDLRFEVWRDPEAVTAAFHKMREYRLPRFQDREDPDLLQTPAYFDFYRELAIEGAATGLSRMYTMSMDGRPISCVWGLADRGRFLTVLGGFDLDGYKNYSIGALVFEGIAGDCIRRGENVLDFTIGDEPYKQLFGTQPTGMWMMSASGSPLGVLVGFVTEQVPWTMRLAKRIANRRTLALGAPTS